MPWISAVGRIFFFRPTKKRFVFWEWGYTLFYLYLSIGMFTFMWYRSGTHSTNSPSKVAYRRFTRLDFRKCAEYCIFWWKFKFSWTRILTPREVLREQRSAASPTA